jgi:hypothetical protein
MSHRIRPPKGRPSFIERLAQQAKEIQDRAQKLRPGRERDALLKQARQLETASHLNEWLSSPGLQPPK